MVVSVNKGKEEIRNWKFGEEIEITISIYRD
jgi:hypothetical protein